MFGILNVVVSFVSYTVMVSGYVLYASWLSYSYFLLVPLMLIYTMHMFHLCVCLRYLYWYAAVHIHQHQSSHASELRTPVTGLTLAHQSRLGWVVVVSATSPETVTSNIQNISGYSSEAHNLRIRCQARLRESCVVIAFINSLIKGYNGACVFLCCSFKKYWTTTVLASTLLLIINVYLYM